MTLARAHNRDTVPLIGPLKWLEMHLKLSWCGENLYTFSIKKRRLKKSFLH